MKTRYHINPETMRPNICRAEEPESCPYFNEETGTPAPHFNSKPEAREYVERVMEKEHGETTTIFKGDKSSNISPFLQNYLKQERGEVVSEETLDGLRFRRYSPLSGGELDGHFTSDVVVAGNIKDFNFAQPGIHKNFGFKGSEIEMGYKETPPFIATENLDGLSEDELKAIKGFTAETDDYVNLNNLLYKGYSLEEMEIGLRTLGQDLESALNKAPKFQKIVYRGVDSDSSLFSPGNLQGRTLKERVSEYVATEYKIGSTVNFKGFQSASAASMMGELWSGSDGVFFEISTPEGLSVRNATGYIAIEEEVILPRDSEYVVVGKQFKNGKHFVQLLAVDGEGEVLTE